MTTRAKRTWRRFHDRTERARAVVARFRRAVGLIARCTDEERERANAMLADLEAKLGRLEQALAVLPLTGRPPPELAKLANGLIGDSIVHALELRHTLSPERRREHFRTID